MWALPCISKKAKNILRYQKNKQGLWSDSNPIKPSDWRKNPKRYQANLSIQSKNSKMEKRYSNYNDCYHNELQIAKEENNYGSSSLADFIGDRNSRSQAAKICNAIFGIENKPKNSSFKKYLEKQKIRKLEKKVENLERENKF